MTGAGAGDARWEPAPVPVLRRWEDSGAVWRVVAESPEDLIIALLRCDAGEEVERLRCSRAAVAGYLGGKPSSEAVDEVGSAPPSSG